MTDERPDPGEIDGLRRQAAQGPRPDPAALYEAAAGRAAEHRRRRRRALGAAAVVVVAVALVSIAATRGSGTSDLDTIGTGVTHPTGPTTATVPSTGGTSPPPSTAPGSTLQSTDTGRLLETGGILGQDGGDLVVIDPATGNRTLVLAGLTGDWSPDRRELAVTTTSPNTDDGLSVIDIDGSHRRQIYFGAAKPSDPTWSPDGRRIAFTVPANNPDTIMTVNADGTDLHVVGRGRYPAWSADGRSLFANTLDDDVQIQQLAVDGSGAHPLVLGPGQHGYPAADATQLAFADFATHAVHTSRLDGTFAERLVDCQEPVCDQDITPRFSPDGSRVAFVRTRSGGYHASLVIKSLSPDGTLVQYEPNDPGDFFLLSWR